MRAALYARVSSEEQVEGYSIDAQLRAGHGFARERGWHVVSEYVDKAKSARSEDTGKRPKFRELLRAAQRKEFDVLIVHKLDRFSRNLLVTLRSFDDLYKNDVTFISISEQIDFTTPMGKVFLAMAGAFAQFYSDNLSQETKKGWNERREQGLYCGRLPFGAAKGEDGVPIPDMQDTMMMLDGRKVNACNYDGLVMSFELASNGKSDRDVAMTLNSAGYRTTGTHGPRPFSKDTVKTMLRNRFYLGFIPDGNNGWLKAKHGALVAEELFEEVQRIRARRSSNPRPVRSDARTYSLSGLARCGDCGSTLRSFKGRGRVRLACNGRLKKGDCGQSSTFLDSYEEQLVAYLRCFTIPPDYQDKILAAHRSLETVDDTEKKRGLLESRLRRIKELYEWGHKSREEYLGDHASIKRELQQPQPSQHNPDVLERLAAFLGDLTVAWGLATQEHRNRLACTLFEAVWIKERKVVAVTPRPEFKPFFDLQYEGVSHGVLHWRPRGGSGSRLHSFGEVLPVDPEERLELRLGFHGDHTLVFDPDLLEQAASKPVPLLV